MGNSVEIIKKETTDITKQAADIVIGNQEQYEGAANFLKSIKGLQKKIKETFDPIVNAALKTHREAVAKRKEHLDPTYKAEDFAKSKMVAYTNKQELIRKAQEEKLARQARAEEERKKKALEEQARKKDEEARKLREQAAKADAEEKARLEAQAQKAEEKAEEKRDKKEEVKVDAPVLASRTETPKGIAYKVRWAAEVVDFSKLPDTYKLPNMSMLNRMAQAGKGRVPIPGVAFKSEKTVASGAK